VGYIFRFFARLSRFAQSGITHQFSSSMMVVGGAALACRDDIAPCSHDVVE
jgi:hypothetical protein